MKSLQVAMFPQEAESSIGKSIVLISNEGKALEIEQFLRITEVSTRTAIMMVDGKQVEYKIATYGLSDALKADFVGLSAKQWYSGEKSTTIIRDTIVADTGKYYSSANLQEAAQVGDYSVVAKDVYTQLVPSAQTETPMVNINAAGDSVALLKLKMGCCPRLLAMSPLILCRAYISARLSCQNQLSLLYLVRRLSTSAVSLKMPLVHPLAPSIIKMDLWFGMQVRGQGPLI